MNDRPNLDINWAIGTPKAAPTTESPKVAQKKATLEATSIQKMAMYGSPAEKRTVATAIYQDNRLGETAEAQDILHMNPVDFANKYGDEAQRGRTGFAGELSELHALKWGQRTNGETARDSAIDAGLMAANTVGGAAALGAQGVDQLLGTTLSPRVSQGLDWMNETGREAQSELMQERRQQHGLEAELDRQDREARYQERRAENEGGGAWASSVRPWLQKQGEAMAETVANYGDDPIMAGSLVPEGIGSLAPNVLAIRAVGKAGAMRALRKRGLEGEAAEQFLETAEGRALLAQRTEAAAPLVVGATESGAAVNQTQQDILSMDEAELRESDQYLTMRDQGMSHEDAQMQLARDAGGQAAVTAAPGALLAGRLAKAFEGNPLATGGLRNAASTVAKETLEEGLQEANSQVATNVSVAGVGIDRAIDEGVAEAAAQGALSGMAMAGPLQAPGAIIQTAKATGEAVLSAGQAGVKARQDSNAAKIDASSPTGAPARAKAAQTMMEAGSEVLSSVESQTTPEQSEAPAAVSTDASAAPVERDEIVTNLRSGLFVPEADLEAYDSFGGVKQFRDANPDKPLPRSVVIENAGAVLDAKTGDIGADLSSALVVLSNLKDMGRMDGTKIGAAIGALPEGDKAKASYDSLRETISTFENTGYVARAREVLSSLTPEQVTEYFQPTQLQDPTLPAADRESLVMTLSTIAEVNPEAIDVAQYDLALDQIGSGPTAERAARSLKTAKQIVDSFTKADAAKAAIVAAQGTPLNGTVRKPSDIVREEISISGNSDNNLPSLNEHRRRIVQAAQLGREEEAAGLLTELRHFAQSQANKVAALNRSATQGGGSKSKVTFRAYGPFAFYSKDPKDGVWVDLANPRSVALAQEIHVDAQTAADLVTALSDGYGIDVKPVQVPKLSRTVRFAPAAESSTGSDEVAQPKAKAPKANTDQAVKKAPTAPAEPEAEGADTNQIDDLENMIDRLNRREERKAATADKQTNQSTSVKKTEPEVAAPAKKDSSEKVTARAETPAAVETEANTEAETVTEAVDPDAQIVADTQPDDSETPDAPAVGWMARAKEVLVKGRNGANALADAFKARNQKEAGSTLTAHDDPVGWIQENLETLENMTDEQRQALAGTMAETWPYFQGEFGLAVDGALEKLENAGYDLENSLTFSNTVGLNALVETEDGLRHVEPRIVQAAFMATFEWMLANGGPRRKMDDEAINKMFGRPRGATVTQDMKDAAKHGASLQMALENISDKMMQLLDVTSKDDVSIRQTQGVFRSLAATSLEVLMDEHKTVEFKAKNGRMTKKLSNEVSEPRVLEWINTPYEVDGRTQEMMTLKVRDDVIDDDFNELSRLRDPFTRIFSQNKERPRHIGTAPSRVNDTQIGNRLAKLSREERQVVERLQNTPSYLNTPMVGLVEALGPVFNKILGHRELSEADRKKMNVDHLATIDGKNQTLERDLIETQSYVHETRQAAGDMDAGDVPIYHEWRVSSVGRLQQMGPVTPQGSKTAREMIAATNSVLDLDNERHERALWLAVAQALDVKVEKKTFDQIMDDTQRLMQDTFAEPIEMLQVWDQTGELDGDALAAALEATGETMSPKALHALLTAARAFNVMGTDGAANFETALALEADGKTDGPVNAIIHMGTGLFDADQIKRFAKGGLFFSDEPLSLNQFIERENLGGEDLYNLAAQLFEKNLALSLQEDGESKLRTMRVLEMFLGGDFVLGQPDPETGVYDPEVKRGITKNPLTVFLYGSGDRGIAGKLAGQVAEGLAQLMTDLAQQDGTLEDGVIEDLAHMLFGGNVQQMRKWLSNPADARMAGSMMEGMTTKILADFTEPMIEAVDEATGGLQSKMKFTQQVATVQTLIFQDEFKRRMDKLNQQLNPMSDAERKQRRANGEKLDARVLASEEQIRDVYVETMKIAPIYGTDVQNFHISAPAKATLENDTVATSLGGRLKSRGSYIEPADASVKVSPYLTIGTGDGRMILNIYANGNIDFDTSLPVFDGVEMALDTVDEASLQINEQVWNGWMDGNPYQAIAEGFAQMMGYMNVGRFDALDPETKKQITRTMRLEDGDIADYELLRGMQRLIEGWADETGARKAAMKKMAVSVDHMAGAEAPFHQDGTAVVSMDPLDFQGIADTLNEFFRAEMTKRRAARKEAREPVDLVGGYAEKPNGKFNQTLSQIGEAVDGHPGVTRVTGAAVLKLLTSENGASPEQSGTLKDLGRISSIPADAVYFFGEPKALTALRDAEYQGAYRRPVELGQYLPRYNATFIANPTVETLTHEIIHAYTAKSLLDHFANPETSPEHVKFAVARLTELRQDLLQLNTADMTPKDAAALRALQGALQSPDLKGKPAQQLAEVVAYTLSNQSLIEKTKQVKTYRPLISAIQKGLKAIAKLLGIRVNPGFTLFSNIRFNAQLLAMPEKTPAQEAVEADVQVDVALNQAYGDDPRVERIERTYTGRLNRLLENVTGDARRVPEAAILKMRQDGHKAAEEAVLAGFEMNPRQARAFEAVHAAMASGMKLDQPVQRHLYEAFGHVVKTLKPETFLKAWGVSENPSQHDMDRARDMTDFLTGARGLRRTADGRTDMLASFMALAQVDGDLRQVLADMKPAKVAELKWNSVDDWLKSIATTAVNLITRASLKPRRQAGNMGRELDLLSETLTEIQGERRLMAAFAQMGEKMDQANAYVSERMAGASERVSDALIEKSQASTKKPLKVALDVAAMVTALGSHDASAARGEAFTTMLNHAPGWNSLRSLLSDMRGMTESNTPIMRLINPVKAQIDAIRQDFREGVPEELAKHFSRKLSREEWSQLHTVIGKADVLAMGHETAMDLLKDPSSLSQRLADAEEKVSQLGGKFANRYKAKAEALALYMVRGSVTSQNMLRNADAIANLHNEPGAGSKALKAQVTPDLIDAIDQLTSLYAFKLLDNQTLTTIENLMANEIEGMETLTGFHASARQMEIERRDRDGQENLVARNNGWKGYVPALTQQGAALAVFPASQHEALLKRGFVKVADYKGDRNERRRAPRAYYQSTVSGRGAFRQGIAQTVNETWQGVDAKTGQTLPGKTAGLIVGQDAVDLAKALRGQKPGALDGVPAAEYLLPVFDGTGEVVAYERSMAPEMLAKLPQDTHLGRMLGIWTGRIMEEGSANDFNRLLLEEVKAVHDAAVASGRTDEFVNVADPKEADPVIRDAWNTLGWRIKAEAEELFGPGFFPIRREMVDDIIGYRAASVTDAWTGVSRWSEESQEKVREVLETMTPNAFKWLRQAENTVHDLVSYAKTTIIVRSVNVGVGNITSNMLHLSMLGIPLAQIVKGSKDKFSEITGYVKNREEIQRLQVNLAAVITNPARAKPIQARIQALEEANAKLSIAPLLKAGEFSTISENLTEADVAIREGRWADYIETAVDRLPGWSQGTAKNMLITKDSAVFQGLNRMVQYGDFVAKAVQYDHLTKVKGKTEREALDQIFDEFVPYNRLPGRGRDFLESTGLLWFWNYKLRIMKVAARTLRDRPINSLFYMGGVAPATEIQSVWDGSLPGAALDGRLDYSVGPEMGFNAPFMHPLAVLAS